MVNEKDLECASDKGWLKGTYVGGRPSIGVMGKAFWDETINGWHYRPEGGNRDFYIKEGNFVPVRDKEHQDAKV